MSRLIWMGSIAAIALSVLLYLFVSCMSAPPNPYDPSNTKIYLTLESSTGVISADTLTDSVGNTIKVGITANLPSYVDSIGLKFYSSEGDIEIDTILTNLFLLKNNDTLWYKTSFAAKDKSTLVATVFAGQNKNTTYGYFNIFNKPIPHTWPHLVINGTKNITVAQTCSLSVSVNDSNAAQGHSFYVKKDTGSFTQFTPPFKWAPPTGFLGDHQVLFKVTDTDSPAYFDTQTVTITVSGLIDTQPKLPHWNKDSINLNGTEGGTIYLTLSDISTGDSLSFILMPGLPAKDTIVIAVYSYTFAAFDTNNYYPKIIAKDKKGNADTMTIHLWASIPSIADSVGPRITKLSGPATNTRTANPNDTLVYAITDQSGIDTVSWALNSGTATILLPDANGQYTIKAFLTSYHSNKIIIMASDKSSAHNKSADTTILDYNVAPKANDQNLSTKKNTALSITLTADPIDGDSLSGWTVVAPPANGTLSGTAPSLTYTPKTGFLGSDSLTFTVSDGKNTSNVAKIKINVSDVLVVPVAGKTIADIVVNKGQPASVVATVNADANPTPVFSWFKEGGSTSISANQTYTISQTAYTDQGRYKYIVSNSQGSDTSNWITLSIKDVTKPIIVLKGANPQQILVGGKYTELGDSAYDDKDGIITSRVLIDTSKVKLAQIGTYQVIYAVKDSAGNVDTMTRSVQIYGNAPTIGSISGNKETCLNVPVVFSVSATGSQPITYQWMKGTAAAPGKNTDSTYSITPLSIADGGSFYCVVSNGISPDAQSQNITLTVDSPPAISSTTASPSTMPVCQGTQVAFTVTATGTAPLTYSWKKNGVVITNGPNSATYTINSVVASDSGQYSCTVSNGCTPAAISNSIQLKITALPVFSFPPKDTTFVKWAGDSITLTVAASGTGALSYQWYKGTTPLGAASASPTKLINPIALADTGTYTCTVSNGCNPVISKAIILKAKVVAKVAAGDGHSLILMTDGTLWACGENGNGELGVGSVNQITPVLVTTSVKNISAGSGGNNSLILRSDGTLWTCGDDFYGQLGDGTTYNRNTPLVNRMPNILGVDAGQNFSLILKTDGTLWGCGYNGFGQLGDSSTTDRSTPVQITTGVQSIAAGGLHGMILKTDGTLWTSGYNGVGQLGDGTTNDHLKPIQVWTGVKAIAAGANHSLILQNDGVLFGCGFNIFGELGDGSTTNKSNLVQIKTGIQSISAGFEHSLILQTDGSLLGCGKNSNGQLGDNTTIDKYTPVPIMPDVQSMDGGNNYSLIIKKDGTLWACGANDYGQLGDGTIIERHAPVQIKF